jgi:hypothetical protein
MSELFLIIIQWKNIKFSLKSKAATAAEWVSLPENC